METPVVDRAIAWLDENVGEHVTRDELLRKACKSDLPPTVLETFESLTGEQYTRHQVIDILRDRITDEGVVGAHHGGTG